MEKRVVPLLIFLIISIIIFTFSRAISSHPLFAITSLFSTPRAAIYSVVHAQGKLTEIEQLQQENKKIREQLVLLKTLQQDNKALRNQFQETFIPSQKLLPAQIVGFKGNPSTPDGFIVNQGEKNGVKKGMAVVVGRDLVGQVVDTNAYFSELILPLHNSFSTLAETENNVAGIVTGYNEFILFDRVVITDSIKKKELVITKGEIGKNGVGIPQGFTIGEITIVNKSETKPFQSASVKSLVNFNKLSTVFIIVQ